MRTELPEAAEPSWEAKNDLLPQAQATFSQKHWAVADTLSPASFPTRSFLPSTASQGRNEAEAKTPRLWACCHSLILRFWTSDFPSQSLIFSSVKWPEGGQFHPIVLLPTAHFLKISVMYRF